MIQRPGKAMASAARRCTAACGLLGPALAREDGEAQNPPSGPPMPAHAAPVVQRALRLLLHRDGHWTHQSDAHMKTATLT